MSAQKDLKHPATNRAQRREACKSTRKEKTGQKETAYFECPRGRERKKGALGGNHRRSGKRDVGT